MIRRDLVPEIGGEIFDTEFHHVGVDNLLWAKCKKKGEEYRSTNAVMIHHHFSKPNQNVPMDEVYQEGWRRAKEDRELLQKKLKELG